MGLSEPLPKISSPTPFSGGWTAVKKMSASAVLRPKISQNNLVFKVISVKVI
jgi:hypothetical protein